MGVVSFLTVVAVAMSLTASGIAESNSCTDVKDFYKDKQSDLSGLIFTTRSSASGLSVCEGRPTCCSSGAEDVLLALSRQDIRDAVLNKSESLAEIMLESHNKTDKFFLNLIEDSRKSLHALFNDTYGFLYTANAKVFVKFFDDLKSYYQGGIVDLTDIFEGFFTTLMQKVFKLLNPSYDLHEEYMQCIADNMNVIKPFAGQPKKLSNQVQRSFIAARTFVEALKTGERVARSMKLSEATSPVLSKRSIVDYTKISHCSKCSGFVEVKPCKGACNTALGKCLCTFGENLHQAWAKYMEGLSAVLDRLERPFNVEAVLSPIDVKISESIMMLQENRDSINDAVVRQCGELPENPDSTLLFGISPSGGFKPNTKPLGGFDLSGLQKFNFKSADGSDSTADDSNPVDGFKFDGFGLEGLKKLDMGDFVTDEGNSGSKITKRSADRQERPRRRRRRRKGRRHKKSHHHVRDVTASKRKSKKGQIVPQPVKHEFRFKDVVQELRSGQKDLKIFWQQLPENICASITETTLGENCWDGVKITKYTGKIEKEPRTMGHCDVIGSLDATVRRQAVVLQEMTSKLWHAHRGVDAAFLDHEQPANPEYSGEGSGKDDDESESPVGVSDVTMEKPEEQDLESKSENRRKEKLIKHFKDWEISLMEEALGRSVDSESSWKSVKVILQKHPHLQPQGASQIKLPSEEDFGDLSLNQQKQLKKLLGLHKDGTVKEENFEHPLNDKDVDDKDVVTELSLDTTTSGAASRSWYLIPLFTLVISFNLYALQ